ncbi:MAG TPA: hypothetical protein VIQ78_08275 [Terrimesophilobacter sp.]
MARPERQILEHAVHTIAEQAAKADDLVDEAIEVGHGRSDPLVTHAKMLRLELLKVKADLERELEDLSLNCTKCGLDVHWVQGSGSPPDIGHTGSRRRTASRRSDPVTRDLDPAPGNRTRSGQQQSDRRAGVARSIRP